MMIENVPQHGEYKMANYGDFIDMSNVTDVISPVLVEDEQSHKIVGEIFSSSPEKTPGDQFNNDSDIKLKNEIRSVIDIKEESFIMEEDKVSPYMDEFTALGLNIPDDAVHKKKRCPKTTHQQYLVYLKELGSNKYFRLNQPSPQNSNIVEDTWRKLTRKLNNVRGPKKTTMAWKKIFIDWKYSVKRRAKLIKNNDATGGKERPEKPLTDLECRLLNILGIRVDELQRASKMEVPVKTIAPSDIKNEQLDEEIKPQTSQSIQSPPILENSSNLNSNVRRINLVTNSVKKHHAHNSFFSTLQTVLDDKEANKNNIYNILQGIDSKLDKLVKIKQKQYQLEVLKLHLKYPNVEFFEGDD